MFVRNLESIIVKLIPSILSMVYIVLVGEYYTINDSRDLVFFLSFIFVGSALLKFGGDNYLIREFSSGSKNKNKNLIKQVYSTITIMSIFGLLCIISTVFFGGFDISFLILSLITPAYSIVTVWGLYFLAKHRKWTFMAISQGLLYVVLIVCALLKIDTLTTLIFLGLVLLIVIVLCHFYYMRHLSNGNFLFPISIKYVGRFYLQVKNFSIASLFQMMLNWGVVLIGGIVLVPELVVHFSLAQRFAFALSFFLGAISFFLAPRFAKLFSDGDFKLLRQEYLACWKSGFLYTMITFAMVIVFYFIFYDESLFARFYDPNFLWFLIIFSVGQFVNAAVGPVGIILSMCSREEFLRRNIQRSLLAFLLMSPIVFIYQDYGIAYLATATVIFQNILNFRSSLVIWRHEFL